MKNNSGTSEKISNLVLKIISKTITSHTPNRTFFKKIHHYKAKGAKN
jgi:hypothetical protein